MYFRVPGFTAEISLSNAEGYNDRSIHNVVDVQLLPAIPIEGHNGRQGCIDCIENCDGTPECLDQCKRLCGTSGGGFHCTPMDNSVNHKLCIAANDTWQTICSVECAMSQAVLPPILGTALAAACMRGCKVAADKARADCPPATLCA